MIHFALGWLLWFGLCFSAFGSGTKFFNLEKEHLPDELIVKFKPGFYHQGVISSMQAKILKAFDMPGVYHLKFYTGGDIEALYKKAKQLHAMVGVEYVEANTVIRLTTSIPDDPEFGDLYGLNNIGGTGGTEDADIDAPEAWAISKGSKKVLVGVIDTGIDYNHPDLIDNYWTNPGESGLDENGNDKKTNGIDDDNNGFVDDWRGWDFANNDNNPMDDNNHGTHCAGTIGAKGNNGIGVVGVNWDVSLVGIKFLTAGGSGSLANAVSSIEYSTKIGVDLTSNSWGGGAYSETMLAAIRAAHDAKILFVAAAGNSSSNNDSAAQYPSGYNLPNVIAVSATDHSDQLARFSSYGRTTVHLAAPGVDILSTVRGGGYVKYSGTSMATPHVAGAAALIKAVYPTLGHTAIKRRLMNTVDRVANLATATISRGRLNLYNALENDLVPPSGVENISVTGQGINDVELNFSPSGDDGNEGMAVDYYVHVSGETISSESEWEVAKEVETSLAWEGDRINLKLLGLPFNFVGYASVRAVDNAGNIGPISESIPIQVGAAESLFEHSGDSFDGVEISGKWGIESIDEKRGNALSDSPGGPYESNQANAVTFAPVPFTGSGDPLLVFDTKFDLEINYDYGYVEVRHELNASWVKVASYNGLSDWRQDVINLKSFIDENSTWIQFRFVVKSDQSINKEGWTIDDIRVFRPVAE